MRNSRFKEARFKAIAKVYKEHPEYNCNQIAQVLKLTPPVVYQTLASYGWVIDPRKRTFIKLTSEERDEVVRLYIHGRSVAEISDAIGIQQSSAYSILRKRNIISVTKKIKKRDTDNIQYKIAVAKASGMYNIDIAEKYGLEWHRVRNITSRLLKLYKQDVWDLVAKILLNKDKEIASMCEELNQI